MIDTIISKVNAVADAWDRHRFPEPLCAVNCAVDDLLGVLLEIGGPIPGEEDVKTVIEGTQPKAKFRFPEGLRALPTPLLPITTMRIVQRLYSIDFEAGNVPNWARFIDRFGDVIVRASGKIDPKFDENLCASSERVSYEYIRYYLNELRDVEKELRSIFVGKERLLSDKCRMVDIARHSISIRRKLPAGSTRRRASRPTNPSSPDH